MHKELAHYLIVWVSFSSPFGIAFRLFDGCRQRISPPKK